LDGESDLVESLDGTPVFYSPEQFAGGRYHAKPADVWALGISLYQMVFGRHPFFEEIGGGQYISRFCELSKTIIEAELCLDETIQISTDLKELIVRILDKDPATRPTMDEIVEFNWVKDAGYDPTNPRPPG
jgi:[calcium/calmodulin-dependent protein kinase] kinase